jgi:hypothetical protein
MGLSPMRSRMFAVAALTISWIPGCGSEEKAYTGVLAPLADSVFRLTPTRDCRRVEDAPLAANQRILQCRGSVADTVIIVESIVEDGEVARIVRTWGDTSGAFVLDSELVERFSKSAGQKWDACLTDDRRSGMGWSQNDYYFLLTGTGLGNQQQLIHARGRVPQSVKCSQKGIG